MPLCGSEGFTSAVPHGTLLGDLLCCIVERLKVINHGMPWCPAIASFIFMAAVANLVFPEMCCKLKNIYNWKAGTKFVLSATVPFLAFQMIWRPLIVFAAYLLYNKMECKDCLDYLPYVSLVGVSVFLFYSLRSTRKCGGAPLRFRQVNLWVVAVVVVVALTTFETITCFFWKIVNFFCCILWMVWSVIWRRLLEPIWTKSTSICRRKKAEPEGKAASIKGKQVTPKGLPPKPGAPKSPIHRAQPPKAVPHKASNLSGGSGPVCSTKSVANKGNKAATLSVSIHGLPAEQSVSVIRCDSETTIIKVQPAGGVDPKKSGNQHSVNTDKRKVLKSHTKRTRSGRSYDKF